MQNDLGGAYTIISSKNFNDVILEIIFQSLSDDKYSFSDPKTYALIKMAEKEQQKQNVTACIHGPTGTGKEVISNYLHQNSVRSEKPFVAIHCCSNLRILLEAMCFLDMKKELLQVSSSSK